MSAPTGRAAVVSRHPATLRSVSQALGVCGLSARHALSPQLLPRAAEGEFDVVVVDIDVDPAATPATLVESARAQCPGSPILVTAGQYARHRLVQSIASGVVSGFLPKQGSWLEAASPGPTGTEGPAEEEVAIAVRRLTRRALTPEGPAPYLFGGAPVTERLIGSTNERDQVVLELDALGNRLGLSEERMRRLQMVAEELILNAVYEAPRAADGTPRYHDADRQAPLTLAAQEQVQVRYGSDGRSFAVSVADRFGSLERERAFAALSAALETGGARDPSARGLGLGAVFNASNQLAFHTVRGRSTEVTAVVHIAGTNRAALIRGTSLLFC
jgi:hypothetical protein